MHLNLHHLVWIPQDFVAVEVCSGIKRQVDLFLSVAIAIGEDDVCLQSYGLPSHITQELKAQHIMMISVRC